VVSKKKRITYPHHHAWLESPAVKYLKGTQNFINVVSFVSKKKWVGEWK
jgi:hypothetical protein